jgi:hypothetical protein
MVIAVRWLIIILLCSACAPPTPEAASDALVLRALDDLAHRDRAAARARLDDALRLDRMNERASALRELLPPEELLLELYDVTDLVPPMTELRCDLRIEGVDGEEPGSVGSFSFDTDDDPRVLDADELVDIIESKLDEVEDGSIELSRGVLIVRKPTRDHARIVALLAALRAAPMPRVNGGFVVPSDDFLERIGIDLR